MATDSFEPVTLPEGFEFKPDENVPEEPAQTEPVKEEATNGKVQEPPKYVDEEKVKSVVKIRAAIKDVLSLITEEQGEFDTPMYWKMLRDECSKKIPPEEDSEDRVTKGMREKITEQQALIGKLKQEKNTLQKQLTSLKAKIPEKEPVKPLPPKKSAAFAQEEIPRGMYVGELVGEVEKKDPEWLKAFATKQDFFQKTLERYLLRKKEAPKEVTKPKAKKAKKVVKKGKKVAKKGKKK